MTEAPAHPAVTRRERRTLAVLAVAAIVVVTAALLAIVAVVALSAGASPMTAPTTATVSALPSPDVEGGLPLHEALAKRRSVREFAAIELTDGQLGQLLWAAQGITDAAGHRTAPSAGGLYPLDVYAVSAAGAGRYDPAAHTLEPIDVGDRRPDLAAAALGQDAVADAPLVVVIVGIPARLEPKYGARTDRYLALEAGHAAQNLLLEAVSLELGGVPIGAFDDAAVRRVLGLGSGETPLYLVPVGVPG